MIREATVMAKLDATLSATLRPLAPIVWADGGDDAEDRPAHVRAASAVRAWGARLVIVQDDVNALALLDGPDHAARALLLPRGEGGRRIFGDALGNKRHKMDLEACLTLPDGRLVAVGSGSTPARERLVVAAPDGGVRLFDANALYADLRRSTAFSGSELNVEGAVVVEGAVRLFQRGNGAPCAEGSPVDATGDLDLAAFVRWIDGAGPPPRLERVRRYDLGRSAGVRLGFTDAVSLRRGAVAFIAVAEASPDTYHDGEVVGCRFGIIDGDAVATTDVVDAAGAPVRLKLEGIERAPEGGFIVVADADDPATPALIGRLDVTWRGRTLGVDD